MRKGIKEQLFSLPIRISAEKLSDDNKKAIVNFQHTYCEATVCSGGHQFRKQLDKFTVEQSMKG